MARKHIPLTIVRPAVEELQKITFTENTSGDNWKIPFRYPFVDIANLTELKTAGYFRHEGHGVSEEIGGFSATDKETNLGFQLPITEKLILLVKVNTDLATSDVTLTIQGSTRYSKADTEYKIAKDAKAGDVFEVDLFNFGLYIEGGEVNIEFADTTTEANLAKIDIALIARMA